MTVDKLIKLFAAQAEFVRLREMLLRPGVTSLRVSRLAGSARSLLSAAAAKQLGGLHLFVLDDREEAAYFYNDLYNLLEGHNVLFFPANQPHRAQHGRDEGEREGDDTAAAVQRTVALAQIAEMPADGTLCVVSYPEAAGEKVASGEQLQKSTLKLHTGEQVSPEFVREALMEYGFERVDFVYEPGQFAARGSIVDVFSFADSKPYRIDFFGNEVESIRSFSINTQLSEAKYSEVEIIPNLRRGAASGNGVALFDFIQAQPNGGRNAIVWTGNFQLAAQRIADQHEATGGTSINREDFENALQKFRHVLFSIGDDAHRDGEQDMHCRFYTAPQPAFNKNFDLLAAKLKENEEQGFTNILLTDSLLQAERMAGILAGVGNVTKGFEQVPVALHEGFTDSGAKLCCYTDHQLFARYHRYKLHGAPDKSEQLTIQDLSALQMGDYVVHIDHGVGVFGGLVKQTVNGNPHEFIKLVYQDGDVLFVSVHGLHRISRYRGRDGEPPKIYKLGTGAWQRLKNATKSKVKDIAKDLIALYAKRKNTKGFAFSADSYMQHELEASFIYEDTPDQLKATQAVKADMEDATPMDRLVCGDVGFGKTEVAMRAAFKAVADSKQVAVLVPTTILALQHHKTFSRRLRSFPCRVEYLSRFTTATETRAILSDLAAGKVDVIIGTHKLLGSAVKFKDLGLLIVDEEQKFGVAAKEKLRKLRLNVDTLTLTATPIPRTLQFSLMGARDLSIIQTPPPNRQPIATELHTFSEDVIREAIEQEMLRGGQTFFVHNRVQDISSVEEVVRKVCPDARVTVAHGQMEGSEMEKRVVDFIMGEYDVLVATNIIENGINIPNANTIIINQAQNFGLSDLHQLRGRVGRSNRKAHCYLLAPPASVLTSEARRRLRAIEEFSDLGSGFNIAMQDLDIRGAGNLLGGEQSGFIFEMGFETYQKILNEALAELREEEWAANPQPTPADSPADSPAAASRPQPSRHAVWTPLSDCAVETDMEALIPDSYVGNMSEKIRLYRELDSLQSEAEIAAFHARMTDRFGAMPPAAEELLNVVRMRQTAVQLGFEKIILKNSLMVAYFVGNQQSPYYKSPVFENIMQQIAMKPLQFKVKEQHGKLSLVAARVTTITHAMRVLRELGGKL
ncbi:MAG: transcription-repair coupling factor [Prevotellaceae bacterium]|jgi:transcription-repair coupling factor (superfamily II helicase)|nr:transcription-repair coupling factor [Prevotellaceae bacterium]